MTLKYKIFVNHKKLSHLNKTNTLISDEFDVLYQVPAKPVGGLSLRERVRGAFLVLFNRATFIRWW